MSGSPPALPRVFDMGELMTLTSRPVVAQVAARGCAYRFDYVGAPTEIRGDADAHQRCFQRLMAAAADLLHHGTLNLFGRSEPVDGQDKVAVDLTLVATGELADDVTVRNVVERLSLTHAASGGLSHSTCPFIGARIGVSAPSRSQVMLQVRFEADGQMRQVPAPYAHGASAFLVHPDHEAAEGLAGRLRRLGWDTTLLASDADAALVVAAGLVHPPALLVLYDLKGTDLRRLDSAKRAHPATQVLLAVTAGAEVIGADGSDEAIRVVPLLPSELWDLTSPQADDDGGVSRPAPLQPQRQPVVLIADDNEVNVAVAEGLLRILGYATRSAANGQEAVDACEEDSPAAVLMDVDMPVMNGYEATRRLKAQQRLGQLPGFPIIAFTAGGDADSAAKHGMDDFLPKPVAIGALKRALFRALKGRAPPLR